MARFAVVFNGQEGAFEVHKAGCQDMSKPRKRADCNHNPEVVEGESGDAVLDVALAQKFDDGSYAEAGFSGRVFPCCTDAK